VHHRPKLSQKPHIDFDVIRTTISSPPSRPKNSNIQKELPIYMRNHVPCTLNHKYSRDNMKKIPAIRTRTTNPLLQRRPDNPIALLQSFTTPLAPIYLIPRADAPRQPRGHTSATSTCADFPRPPPLSPPRAGTASPLLQCTSS
jgi:hypothetical protein